MADAIRVLYVEDHDSDARIIQYLLEGCVEEKFLVEWVDTLGKAIAAIHDHSFDLIIADLGLPDGQGLGNVQRLHEAAPTTTIVVLTADDDGADAIDSIRYGAQEYLSKQSLRRETLIRTIRHSLVRQERLMTAQAQAMTDALTGIGNRRAFEREMDRRLHDFRRNNVHFCLAIFDVDFFKKVNDTWGHDVGDNTLRVVGRTLATELRATDLSSRLGGEEFAAILAGSRLEDAWRVSNRIRGTISEQCRLQVKPEFPLTLSGGVAEVRVGDDLETLYNRADEALYSAKENGRDRCMIHDGKGIVAIESLTAADHRMLILHS